MDTRKVGLGLMGAGLIFLVAHFGNPFSGSSGADAQVIERIRQHVENAKGEEAPILEPTIMVSEDADPLYTKEDLLSDVEMLINGSPDGSTNYNHLALNHVNRFFDEFSSKEQEKLRPLILKPTDPESFFHASNWQTTSMSLSFSPFKSYLKQLARRAAPEARATSVSDIEFFEDDLSGYLYIQNGPVKVYYPSDDLLPSGVGVTEADLFQKAAIVLSGATKAFPKYQSLLGQVPPAVDMYLVQDIDGANGMEVACDQIYINHMSADIYATSMHELFHCFQDVVGVVGESGWNAFFANLFGSTRTWMIEGGATFAEHIADPEHNSEYDWYPRYPANPQKSLFTRSYAATLFWREIHENYSPAEMTHHMQTYAGSFDNEVQAQLLHDKFHQIALNVSGNTDMYDSGDAVEPYDHGEIPLDVEYISETVYEGEPGSLPFNLDKMSMQFYDINLLLAEIDYVQFNLGSEVNQTEDDIEISAYVYGSSDRYHKVQLEETDEGEKYFRLCATENHICEQNGDEVFEGMYGIFLVVSNRSGSRSYSGDMTVAVFGPDSYKAYEVVMNEGELTVPIAGRLTLNIDNEEGEMKMKASRFWMLFSNDFYGWDAIEVPESPNVSDVKIHPTRLTKYVNHFCSFRGFVEYDFELLNEDEEDGWVKRTFKIENTDQGNFHVTPHRFVCRMDPKMFKVLGINGPAVVVLQYMFASINTEDYGHDSFAGQLHRIFKEFMTLGLKDDSEGEIEMYFREEGGFETVKIEFNDKLHLYMFKSE